MKPQDILLMIKIFLKEPGSWTISRMAHELYMSGSEVHSGIKRLKASRLIMVHPETNLIIPCLDNMKEFLVHGLKYIFPVEIGKEVRGMATAHSALPLSELIDCAQDDVLVWPYEFGNIRGKSIVPLFRSAPKAAENDICFYRMLVVLDGIRIGRNREYNLSVKLLSEMLERHKLYQ
jgi:hypothetical protein